MVAEYGSSFELVNTVGDGTKLKDTADVHYLRSAREALFLIGMIEKPKCVFMPALCCASMVQPFIQLGVEVHYYKILPSLRIDIEDLLVKIKENSLVIVLHYFGNQTFDGDDLVLIKNRCYGIKIIQDCTQHVFTSDLINDIADYWIGSIRKWVSIADGAFIASKRYDMNECIISIDECNDFVNNNIRAMKLKREYLMSNDIELKNKYREIFASCMSELKKEIVVHSMSNISRRLFYDTVNCLDVCEKRSSNFNELYREVSLIYPDIVRLSIRQVAPLCFNIIVNNRDEVQRKLASLGIYCQVLWPLSEDAKETCEFSKWFSEHMLAVPCDQRYSNSDMIYIAERILSVLKQND